MNADSKELASIPPRNQTPARPNYYSIISGPKSQLKTTLPATEYTPADTDSARLTHFMGRPGLRTQGRNTTNLRFRLKFRPLLTKQTKTNPALLAPKCLGLHRKRFFEDLIPVLDSSRPIFALYGLPQPIITQIPDKNHCQ